MQHSQEKIKIDYGNDFKVLHGEVFRVIQELLDCNKLKQKDICIWIRMLEYMKPYSTEIDISISELAKKVHKSKGHTAESVQRLIENNFIIQHNRKLYINLNYATRGNEVYKHVYDICNAKFDRRFEINMEKSREEDICYDEAF